MKIISSQQSITSKITDSVKILYNILVPSLFLFILGFTQKISMIWCFILDSLNNSLSSHANLYTVIHQPTGYLIVHTSLKGPN